MLNNLLLKPYSTQLGHVSVGGQVIFPKKNKQKNPQIQVYRMAFGIKIGMCL